MSENILDAVVEATANPNPSKATEKLYHNAEGYRRSAPERFVGGHDTVSPKWEYAGAVTSAENLARQLRRDFPREIEKTALQSTDGRSSPHFGLYWGDTCLSTAVKEGYEPHTTEDVLALVLAAREAFHDDVKISSTFHEGHLVCVRPTDKYRREIFGKTDAVNPRIVIEARYGRAFRATLGWFRDCCNNLTWMRREAAISRPIRHTSSLRDHMEELIEEFAICAAGWDETVAYLERMENQRVKFAEFLKSVYGNCPEAEGRAKTNYERRTEKIFARLLAEREKLGRGDIESTTWDVSGWEAFNAIQGYVQHDTRRQNPSALLRAVKSNEDSAVLKAQELILVETAA